MLLTTIPYGLDILIAPTTPGGGNGGGIEDGGTITVPTLLPPICGTSKLPAGISTLDICCCLIKLPPTAPPTTDP
jgi:hypothetical protein